jgi:hypothetical protein
VSIGIEGVAGDLGAVRDGVPAGERDAAFRERLARWEDLLTLVVDPDSTKVRDRERQRALLSFLLSRAGIVEDDFWRLGRAQRGQLLLSRYSRVSREIPDLELRSFDIDKLLKERRRHEPLTIGAAWHHGYWRSYFSHAAITHPANDGLREEFSTAWTIVRKKPAVIFRRESGDRLESLRSIQLDLPMVIGPLPFTDGVTMERAYLEAIAAADPAVDIRTRSLVVVEADRYLAAAAAFAPHTANLMVRLEPRHVASLAASAPLRDLLRRARVIELAGAASDLAGAVSAVLAVNPDLLVSVYLRYGEGFWRALEAATRQDGVTLVHYQSGRHKSYKLTRQVDAFLKARLLRARAQLVSAGGDTDTQASAATVYESVLLGANGGAMTHAAAIALVPEIVDVLRGADPTLVRDSLASRAPEELRDLALSTLTCWQHSILDFLSCMGIDDIQKTSGNTMAITVTEEWVREVDTLATDEFGRVNADLNRRRVAAEPIPRSVRERYKVSSLLAERRPGLPPALAARVVAQQNASYHLDNSNRSFNADFLDVAYRMAAGDMPREEDFFIEGNIGPLSLDRVGLKLSRASLAWSLERLRRDPSLLDYISLAVPRGFYRPGAVPPNAAVSLHAWAPADAAPLAQFDADACGGFELRCPSSPDLEAALADERPLRLKAADPEGHNALLELAPVGRGYRGFTVLRASTDGTVTLRRDPRGGLVLSGFGFREPIWHGPVAHASISLGAASEDFLIARIEGNAGLTMTSSGEGGPIRLGGDEMKWEGLQAASGHFGITAADLRRVRDVEIKINQGAKPGKGGRLAAAKVTATVSQARNIPIGTNALSPDPKHDIYSIEDMPAEVWLWLLYHNHCGIKITGSNYTKYVAAGMWSNFVVDYLLVDAGIGGSGNYHADSSHVGWPDIFRTILHTHHALVSERVDLDGSGQLRPIRDLNGAPFGARGGTRLLASGGLRGELDMLKVLIAGADALVEASIGKAVAFGCNQCGHCYLDCPRGGITTKPELTVQNSRELMRQRFRNWTVLNMVKLAVLVDALNRETGALDEHGRVVSSDRLLDDIRLLRGRTDLLVMPRHESRALDEDEALAPPPLLAPPAVEHDSCRVASLAVSEPITVDAIWEAARVSFNGGNNRGGGLDFAGFAPVPVREKTCLVFNTIGPDRANTIRAMLDHLSGCRFYAADGTELPLSEVAAQLPDFRFPVREKYAAENGWRDADLRENPGDFHLFFVDLEPEVIERYGRQLLRSEHWLQRQTKYIDLHAEQLQAALEDQSKAEGRAADFVADVREEYFTVLCHVLDSRYYRTHVDPGAPAGKYAAKRRGFVVSVGEDLGAIKISGWTQAIPEYFDFDRFWARYPGARGGVEMTVRGKTLHTQALHAHIWGMHHRYPTNSPAIDPEGRGNPAGAHPFKAYNLLLMHNGEQVGVDSTSPFLREFGYVHVDPSMGKGAALYQGDSVYDRKALTDTEYAAYLVDFTRRVLGLTTEDATEIISPITGLDLAALDADRRRRFELLSTNYVQLTPTGPYKFTIVESRGRGETRRVGFRENMDIKFLRPHEIAVNVDTSPGGVQAVANASEAKIADAMLRVLHQQGLLADAGSDLRFNMRPGGRPGCREYGGVVEAFLAPGGGGRIALNNRFGEPVGLERAGSKVGLERPIARASVDAKWRIAVEGCLRELESELPAAAAAANGAGRRLFGPDAPLPPSGVRLVDATLEGLRSLRGEDYRFLVEDALPDFAQRGWAARAAALRVLAELRKRVAFADLGGKALSAAEYLTDGGRDRHGAPEGGIFRILDAVPLLHEALAGQPAAHEPVWARITADTLNDLDPPSDGRRDVLVIDFQGFRGEAFTLESASRFLSECVRLGWRHIVAFGFAGGPRYVGTNLADSEGAPAKGVVIEIFGRESGDFLGALLEGAEIWVYGQAQSHAALKADSGYLFMLQDALNTCAYAAHGGTINVWDTGSRFAVAGQNKVYLRDGATLAPGFKSIHFGSPNEYAFEYLMSGGQNSLHVVMGLAKPDAGGELSLRPRPYAGKFFMSGAAAGRVFVFDPARSLEPGQYEGNAVKAVTAAEWADELGPFVAREAGRRGAPIRIDGNQIDIRLAGTWQHWRYDRAFVKLVPGHGSEQVAGE